MVADMETIPSHPDRHTASAALDVVAEARRAVRDRPWPLWLYLSNAVLLAGVALTGLIETPIAFALVAGVLAMGLAALNYWAGTRMGTPFAIPTSPGFRICAITAGAFVIASLLARGAGLPWVVVLCAGGVLISYGLGAAFHRKSTRR